MDIDPTAGDGQEATPKALCSRCGKSLSRYNKIGYCFTHILEEKGRVPRPDKRVREFLDSLNEACGAADEDEFFEFLRAEGLSLKIEDPSRPSFELILELVAAQYRLEMGRLVIQGRTDDIVIQRQVLMYLAREDGKLSYPEIGRHLGRDHTTILYGANKIKDALAHGDRGLSRIIATIRSSYPRLDAE